MGRKIVTVLCCTLVLTLGFAKQTHAATHTIYEQGTLSSTYTTYFKDILSGAKFNDNYVAFRSGQYSYSMVVGDLEYNNGVISMNGKGKEYVFTTGSGYNGQTSYEVSEISSFSVNCSNYIVYSDCGDYPQLIERGAKYEMVSLFILSIVLLCIVINRIFFRR